MVVGLSQHQSTSRTSGSASVALAATKNPPVPVATDSNVYIFWGFSVMIPRIFFLFSKSCAHCARCPARWAGVLDMLLPPSFKRQHTSPSLHASSAPVIGCRHGAHYPVRSSRPSVLDRLSRGGLCCEIGSVGDVVFLTPPTPPPIRPFRDWMVARSIPQPIRGRCDEDLFLAKSARGESGTSSRP